MHKFTILALGLALVGCQAASHKDQANDVPNVQPKSETHQQPECKSTTSDTPVTTNDAAIIGVISQM